MTKRTATLKLPVRPDKQCQLLLRNGTKCTNIVWSIATRHDGSTMRLCKRHAVKLRDQISEYPEVFSPMRFSLVEK